MRRNDFPSRFGKFAKSITGCDHHMRIGAAARFALFDESAYELLDLPDVTHDPLKFKDQKKYAERLKEARAKAAIRMR